MMNNQQVQKAKMLLIELQSIKEGDFQANHSGLFNLVAEALKDAEHLATMVMEAEKPMAPVIDIKTGKEAA